MKIEYDNEHDLLNIEFLVNVPIDGQVYEVQRVATCPLARI